MGGLGLAMGIGQSAAAAAEQKKATDEQKKKKSIMEEQESEENALYNKKRYSDISKRTDFRNLFRLYAQNQRNADAASEARGAITGATPEQKEAAREVNRRTFADAVAGAVTNANQLKDQYDASHQGHRDRYYSQRLGMQDQLANIHANSANQWASGAVNAFNAGGNMLMTGLGGLAAQGKLGAITGNAPAAASATPTNNGLLPNGDFIDSYIQNPDPARPLYA